MDNDNNTTTPGADAPGVLILSETGNNTVCTVPLGKGETAFCDELLAMACSLKSTQDIFPRAQPSTFKLCDERGVALAPHVLFRAGDTVYLHSNKDGGVIAATTTAVAATATSCVVVFCGVQLVVPHAPEDRIAVLEWACEMFGEAPSKYVMVKSTTESNALVMTPRVFASTAESDVFTTTVRFGDAVVYAPYSRGHAVTIRHWACKQLALDPYDYELVDTGDEHEYTLLKMERVADAPAVRVHEVTGAYPVKDTVSGRQTQVVCAGYIPLCTTALRMGCEGLFLDANKYDLSGPPGHAVAGRMMYLVPKEK